LAPAWCNESPWRIQALLTKPALGTATQPFMDLNSVDVVTGDANTVNTLKIVFTVALARQTGSGLLKDGGTHAFSPPNALPVGPVPVH
jgi:hypothetical protein